MIELLNIDCMEYMKTCKDKEFDFAVVDPPYFKGPDKSGFYRNGKKSKTGAPAGKYEKINSWLVPDDEYYSELLRVSNHQVIWGINYFNFKAVPVGRIVWDKKNGASSFSDGEIASCSLIDSVRFFRYMWNGMLQENMKNKEIRIHPTQKPVPLYDWIFSKFLKDGWRVLDTHLGSASSAISANKFNCDFVGCELDQHYYKTGLGRFNLETKQISMF